MLKLETLSRCHVVWRLACDVAGESISFGVYTIMGSCGWSDLTVRGITSPVARAGGVRVGKGTGYNRMHAANAIGSVASPGFGAMARARGHEPRR